MTDQHRNRTPRTPYRTLCPLIVCHLPLVHHYICEKEVLPQRCVPAVFASNVAYLKNREFLPPLRLGVFLFSIVKQKRYPNFQNYIHEHSMQFNYNFRF